MTRAEDLRAVDAKYRVRALADLQGGGDAPTAEETDALLDCLAHGRKLVQRRAAETCAALIRRGVDIVPPLRAALVAADRRLRWGAAYALSLAGELSPQSLDVLVEVLASDDGDLRWAALDLLKRFAASGREAVVPRLVRLATDGAPQQRKMALYALRDLEVVALEAGRAAAVALRASEIDLRLAGIATLGRLTIDRQQAAASLLALLDDPVGPIRRAAAAALGALGIASPEVVAALQRVRASDDAALRRAAERSLRLLTSSPV